MAERSAHRRAGAVDIARTPPAARQAEDLRAALHGLRRILNAIALDAARDGGGHADALLLASTRRMIAERYRRYRYFDGQLFSDPAWDIMLELFVAAIEGREVPVTNLCATSNVPDTTMLRWIRTLCEEGLVVRHKDDVDKRRVLVRLTAPAVESMRGYIGEQMAAAEAEEGGPGPI